MGPRFKIYGHLVLWIVGMTVATALLWNALGVWMNSMEGADKTRSLALGFTEPLAYVAYALPALLFGPLMWASTTGRERLKLEPLKLPKPLAILNRMKGAAGVSAMTIIGYFVTDKDIGGAIGGFVVGLFIAGMMWAGSTIHKDDRKSYHRRASRKELAKRIDVAIDNYIKLMPPVKTRARDKEYPFLSRIHHVNQLALNDDHIWNGFYMNYTAGTLRSVEMFMTELKMKLFRDDIIWALLHAAQAVLEPSDAKYDADKAETSVQVLEALVAPQDA